jgi:cyclopropane-fatty-acyl-phospholipid synthase
MRVTMVKETLPDPPAAPAPGTEVARDIVQRVFAGIQHPVAVVLKDGTILREADGPREATIILREPATLRLLLTRGSDLAASEGFIRSDIEVDGSIESVLFAMDSAAVGHSAAEWAAIAVRIARLPRVSVGTVSREAAKLRGRRHSPERDRSAIAYHYDLSNDLFGLFLDESLGYSSAYFRSETESVDEAQAHKYDLVCRKLRLREGERLLDMGCGWGGLLRFAAREYGARVTGVTTSQRQEQYNLARIEREGLSARCTIAVLDYRNLGDLGTFDKAASLEMAEHVGDEMMPVFFASVFDRLVPGALFLNQNIIAYESTPSRMRALAQQFLPQRSAFTEKYVFPDGKIPRLPLIAQAAQDAGFEVRDVENLREHYVLTLQHWIRQLESNETEARAMVGDATYNTFRLWVGGSLYSFASGRLGVVQTLFAKWIDHARALVPPTRVDIYN